MEGKRNKIINKKTITFISIFAILLSIQIVLVCLSFPIIKLSFVADEVGESICLFYGQAEEPFTEEMMSYKEISSLGRQTYFLETDKDIEKIRVDIGVGEGKACVYDIEIKSSLFSKAEIEFTNLDTIIYSSDVGKLYVEDNILVIESIGYDPHFIITDVEAEENFDGRGFLVIGVIGLFSLIVTSVIFIIIFYGKNVIINSVSYFKKNRAVLFIICGLFISVMFFALPVMFTYDSSTYMAYFDIFDKELALSQWGRTRGWGFPLFLWSVSNVFGNTAYGMNVALFILYTLFIICLYLIWKKYLLKCDNGFVSILFFVFVILNPIILGYFHIILTECLATTIVCLTEIILMYLHSKDMQTNAKKFSILKIVLIICSCTVLYFIKQMFFVIPLISYFLLELSMILYNRRKIV